MEFKSKEAHINGLLGCSPNENGNLVHSVRTQSFLKNNWPYLGPESICNPEKLALAGLIYEAGEDLNKHCARCIICFTILKNLKDSTDPWEAHKQQSPDCLWIQFGKRNIDDYTMREVLKLWHQMSRNYVKRLKVVSQKQFEEKIALLKKAENELGE